MPQTILLVPSDHFNWLGLEALLRGERGLCVLDPARDPDAAMHAATTHQPTFVVLAADLKGAPVVALAGALQARSPGSTLVVIGPPVRHAEHLRLLEMKIACYVRWEEVSPERLRCILALVHDADVRVMSGAVADQLVPSERRRRPRDRALVLTERERAVMAGLAAGHTREGIAVEAHLGLRTVKRTVAALCTRFDAPTLFVLGMTAVAHGFAPVGQQPWPERATMVAHSGHATGKDGPNGPSYWPEKPFTADPTRCMVDP